MRCSQVEIQTKFRFLHPRQFDKNRQNLFRFLGIFSFGIQLLFFAGKCYNMDIIACGLDYGQNIE